jgi:hypothetical protein
MVARQIYAMIYIPQKKVPMDSLTNGVEVADN